MMINDGKMCSGVTAAVNNDEICRTDTMLSRLRGLTECLHNIESKIIGISNTLFFETSKERTDTEAQDINTEIIHDHEVALAIIDALSLLETGIGINQ